MLEDRTQTGVTTAASVVGGAVGVSNAPRRWYVAIVTANHEKAVGDKLAALGIENYVATQPEMRVWRNGRRKLVDRVVLRSMVFIRCTEAERLQHVRLPYIIRYMTDRAAGGDNLRKPPAVIPDRQIDTLRFMLGNSDNPVSITQQYAKGDKVRVARGGLRGLEGEVLSAPDGKSILVVSLDLLGTARVEIDTMDLEPLRS